MRDPFFQALEKHVGGLFEAVRAAADLAGERYGRTPYTNELFPIEDEFLIQYLERTICRALAHRTWFRETAPPWAPELPLSPAEWNKMICGKSKQIAVVGYFGRSLACAEWSNIHFSFADYVSGLMAYEHTPPSIRADPALLKEYPPRLLHGFDKSLCWGAHFRIIEFTQQLMRTEEIWWSCGMADDVKRMQDAIEQLLKLDRGFSSK